MERTRLLPRGSTGFAVDIAEDGARLALAGEVERLGYDTVWIPGGRLDRLDRVSELIEATSTVRVATGIVPLGVFDVAAVAAAYTADRTGRFVLGLGVAQQAHPLAALDSHLDELDAAGVPVGRRLLAALGPRKLAVARERSAGAITLLVTPESTAQARAALGDDAELVVYQPVVVHPDPVVARDAGRDTARFLAGVAGYRAHWLRMGFTDRDVDELSDAFVDAVIAHGDPDAVADRVAAHRSAGADHVVISPLQAPGAPGPLDTARLLADRLVQ